MNKERILRLADHMECVKPETYNQDDFGLFNNTNIDMVDLSPDLGKLYTVKIEEGFCGTAACIAGHACFIPEFSEAGLKMKVSVDLARNRIFNGGPYFDNSYNFTAMSKFLDIPEDHSEILFGQNGGITSAFYGTDATPQDVADKLREYAENPEVLTVLSDSYYDDSCENDSSWYDSWEEY